MPRLLFVVFLSLIPCLSSALDLSMPMNCTGTDLCFVQNYFDHDPSPGYADYQCGLLSYDGHTGTDVRVSSEDMRKGVRVFAAAPGVVVGLRDGMEDVSIRVGGVESVKGREAGNGVLVDHGGGWFTQYNHMRNGSVAVKMGQQVERGQYLGLVGLSGMTEFPHLELVVRRDGKELDPFTGTGAEPGCSATGSPLFDAAALGTLHYSSGGGLDAGFADHEPDLSRLLQAPSLKVTGADAGALVFWAAFYGVQAGDEVSLVLMDARGKVLASNQTVLSRAQAQRKQYVGKRRKKEAWPAGMYSGEAVLRRDGRELTRMKRHLVVE